MFSLKMRMYVLVALMFSFLYAVVTMISYAMGVVNFGAYFVITIIFMLIQYMLGPKMVEWSMRVRYVKDGEYSQLVSMVRELAHKANIPMPRVAVSQMTVPNAFAYGRWLSDGRVCVTQGILQLLNPDELNAVLAHEISHIKNRDVLTITLLSVIPLVLYRIAFHMFFYGGRSRREGQSTLLFGLAALVMYFITNLIVLYGSRIREYFADQGAVQLGNHPKYLASALYKLVYGSARMSREQLREVEGMKAFFVNDPSRAVGELKELSQIDVDGSGTIDAEELRILRAQVLKLNSADKFFEIFSTHPNMLKRIKRLSTYVAK
ncbi:MAG: M48 family metalloprotease [Candidatus Omnitrophica bacterium]|nr:M48 family metalloprotease [Candidatus Omnitrophota bacterium]MBU4477553.1 M48 family metalloprotease [Candidatus Omnitrophota bacterium]MCG2703581.1 zinc metalloprotease HtpX [Candidatus Omnitrophota bacterium]